jgi:hypothetical protein
MSRRRRLPALIAGALVLVLAGPASPVAAADDPVGPVPGDELRIIAVDTSDFPDVEATVALPATARRQPAGSANLTVTSAEQEVEATVERLPVDRQAVAILIDTDERTEELTLVTAQAAATDLVRQLDPARPVVVASSTGGTVFGPDTDRAAAIDALADLRLGGTRDWPATLAATMDTLVDSTSTTVVVVSTGPSGDTDVPPELVSRLADDSVKVRWVSLGAGAGPAGDLEDIPSVVSATRDGLLVRLDAIAAELVAQYRLTFRVDPRATSVAVTLLVDGDEWTAGFPVPLPSSGYVAPSPDAAVAPTTTPRAPVPGTAGDDSTGTGPFLAAGAAALLLLGLAVAAVRVRPPADSGSVPQPG